MTTPSKHSGSPDPLSTPDATQPATPGVPDAAATPATLLPPDVADALGLSRALLEIATLAAEAPAGVRRELIDRALGDTVFEVHLRELPLPPGLRFDPRPTPVDPAVEAADALAAEQAAASVALAAQDPVLADRQDHNDPQLRPNHYLVSPVESAEGWRLHFVGQEGWTLGPISAGEYRALRQGEPLVVRDTWREDEDAWRYRECGELPRSRPYYELRAVLGGAFATAPATPAERLEQGMQFWAGPGWPVRTWAVGRGLIAQAAQEEARLGEPIGFVEYTVRQTTTFYTELQTLAWLQAQAAAGNARQVGPRHFEMSC
jgi:hypothetical protein